ncbi:MAG TPA: RNA methyltransferase [Smithellaceae bacterium]|nr:RNA methyltransferase [Smithellaceae bacterium]HPL96917.1 RNA methyltransferase [Smithellaceae bacterium]HQF83763.1 RNA methyltransferase [Smithellaceae bacterium]HQG79880.1 RNA methyltransferase [Smithellaceae bacterium]
MQLFHNETHLPGHPAGASALYIALLHYPVVDKKGRVVTTAIANTDIHDIARIAKTFGVEKFYIVNPVEAQRRLAQRIMSHWREGYGAEHNPCRKEAFEKVALRTTLDEVLHEIEQAHGRRPAIVATGANFEGDVLTCVELRRKMMSNSLPYLLIFGTGSGIAVDVLKLADHRLEPIRGKDGYNHLAVRSAVAVILDRVTTTF